MAAGTATPTERATGEERLQLRSLPFRTTGPWTSSGTLAPAVNTPVPPPANVRAEVKDQGGVEGGPLSAGWADEVGRQFRVDREWSPRWTVGAALAAGGVRRW
jgi:hypothetical protein